MNVFLMHENIDFAPNFSLQPNADILIHDLELKTLLEAISGKDDFIEKWSKVTLLSTANININTIIYRQNILRDCIENPSVARKIYSIAVNTIEEKNKLWDFLSSPRPSAVLYNSIKSLEIFITNLQLLRTLADQNYKKLKSTGFTRFFEMLKKELTDEYIKNVKNILTELKFEKGILLSTTLGEGNKDTGYKLRKTEKKSNWFSHFFENKNDVFTFQLNDRDIQGCLALGEIKDKGIVFVANSLAQATDHIQHFFEMLKTEMAFYIGCLNLYDNLINLNEPVCFPIPVEPNKRQFMCEDLYDPCLAITQNKKIVGNDINAENKILIFITGANQGGKSTFLRSVGIAQLMMQCGMFVPAKYFMANICDAIFSHFKREEDNTMKSGKLDEELNRMNEIINYISQNSLLLFNESFSATNERESSQISNQIITPLFEKNIKMFYVTHNFDFLASLVF